MAPTEAIHVNDLKQVIHTRRSKTGSAGDAAADGRMAPGRGGRKVGNGGKNRKNKDHRQSGLKQRANKGRWDDICARQLQPDLINQVLAEKTKPDPDLPGLGQHYCVACRFAHLGSCERMWFAICAYAERSLHSPFVTLALLCAEGG
jgi:hypothetical protein